MSRGEAVDGGPVRRLPGGLVQIARTGWPLLVIAGAVILVNGPTLLHLVITNPLVTGSGLGHVTRASTVPGMSTLDPNNGYTSLALEHRAALDWVHGQLPLWVGQEGLGAPLLAEQQSAAFSPLSLLTLLPQGLLLQHMLCELIAGAATYLLARQLGFARGLATFAGVVFALNGTFAWLGNAVVNPICYLPVMLLGLERIRARRRHGAAVLALGVCFSLIAGFPEVAAIDFLFVGVWALTRLAGVTRWAQVAMRDVAGVVVGALLAAPAWVPFEKYLPIAYTGGHTNSAAYQHLTATARITLGLPYALGDTDEYLQRANLRVMWGSVGGYLTATVLVLAVVGLGARDAPRLLRAGIVAWVVVAVGRSYGWHPAEELFAHVPEIERSSFYRYSPPSFEMAASILAAYGAQEIARTRATARAWVSRVLIALTALGLVLVYRDLHVVRHEVFPHGLDHIAEAQLVVAGAAVVFAFAATWRWRRVYLPVGIVVALALAETLASFVAPALTAPKAVAYDPGPAQWLHDHATGGRVFVVSGVAPNFGAYFGFRMLDVNDLPIPELWRQTVIAELQPQDTAYYFPLTGTVPGRPTNAQNVQAREAIFESIGVGYVVAPSVAELPRDATVVHRSTYSVIGALPHQRPLISAAAGGPCTAAGPEYATFTVDCAAPATLRVLQLDLPGWSARVRGVSTPIERDPTGPFQLLSVPAGRSTVVMSYWAPGLSEGLALGGVGVVGGLLLWNVAGLSTIATRGRAHRRGRRARRADTEPLPTG